MRHCGVRRIRFPDSRPGNFVLQVLIKSKWLAVAEVSAIGVNDGATLQTHRKVRVPSLRRCSVPARRLAG